MRVLPLLAGGGSCRAPARLSGAYRTAVSPRAVELLEASAAALPSRRFEAVEEMTEELLVAVVGVAANVAGKLVCAAAVPGEGDVVLAQGVWHAEGDVGSVDVASDGAVQRAVARVATCMA